MRETIAYLLISFISFASINVDAFEVGSHKRLSEQAVFSSNLDTVLRTQLNVPGGVGGIVAGRTVIDRISDGSVLEDVGFRSLNHFHNPQRSWDRAGLLGLSTSSVIWMQQLGQGFAWQEARDEYFRALKASTQGERETRLARTFEILGHLIHLPQDKAEPAHTRNDPHPVWKGLESFVESVRTSTNPLLRGLFDSWITSSVGIDPSVFSIAPNPLAPIPVARIIDTTDPEVASGSPRAGNNQGLAEYSNENFLSEDTIFKDFTFPRVESLGAPFDTTDPFTGRPRRYFPKVADGDTGYRLVAEGTWTETLASLSAGDQGYILDSGVFQDYAARLLPRAIGYSAGLIDYFFRGTMTVTLSENQPAGNPITQVRVKVANDTPNEETGNGEAVAVALLDSQILAISPQTGTSPVTLTRVNQELVFDFSHSPLPADAQITVVYRGPLGFENGAVIAGRTPLTRIIHDFFERSNSNNLGLNWFEIEAADEGPPFSTQTFLLSGNSHLLGVATDMGPPFNDFRWGFAWFNGNWSKNQFSEFKVAAYQLGTQQNGGIGPAVRINTTGSVDNFTGYVALIVNNTYGGAQTEVLELWKAVNASTRKSGSAGWTLLGSAARPQEGSFLRIDVTESTITVTVDDEIMIQAIDSSIVSGQPGIASVATEAGDPNNPHAAFSMRFDDWTGGGLKP